MTSSKQSTSTEEPKYELSIGGRPIEAASGRPKRLTGLIWGSAGTGKTTLAATAPGRKLIVSFDPDGATAVSGFESVDVADFTKPDGNVINSFKKPDNPIGLAEVIEQYDTFIIDSLTNIGYHCLQRGIAMTNGATIERPSPGAYQVRNALVLQLVKNSLALTAKHGKHIIFIAHEDEPVKNEEGLVLHITLALGGKLPEQTALDFSEVWCLQDPGVSKNRRILIRPCRSRKPCKTRMFTTMDGPEFEWTFNPETQEGMTIASWYEEWHETGKKIALPTVPKVVKKRAA